MNRFKRTVKYNKINDHVEWPKEINNGPKLVHDAGYIPLPIRIARLTAAGMQLESYRDGYYDFKDIDMAELSQELPEELVRAPNYDVADASQALRNLELKITEKKRLAEESARLQEQLDAEPEDTSSGPADLTPNE